MKIFSIILRLAVSWHLVQLVRQWYSSFTHWNILYSTDDEWKIKKQINTLLQLIYIGDKRCSFGEPKRVGFTYLIKNKLCNSHKKLLETCFRQFYQRNRPAMITPLVTLITSFQNKKKYQWEFESILRLSIISIIILKLCYCLLNFQTFSLFIKLLLNF